MTDKRKLQTQIVQAEIGVGLTHWSAELPFKINFAYRLSTAKAF